MDWIVGDTVTRISHNNDCEFVIKYIDTEQKIALLKGKCVRLNADAPLSDLKEANDRYVNDETHLMLPKFSINTMFGKVLHLDGDSNFLDKCMRLYRKYAIPSVGYYMEEKNMPFSIGDLLRKHKPDVLVITGHDALSNSPFSSQYMNSAYFFNAVLKAREYQPSKDLLAIIVGGCQSDFKRLIEYANFASSPAGINISALDPAIVAIMVSMTSVNESVNVLAAINQTSSKNAGITGVDTRGMARKLY